MKKIKRNFEIKRDEMCLLAEACIVSRVVNGCIPLPAVEMIEIVLYDEEDIPEIGSRICLTKEEALELSIVLLELSKGGFKSHI